MNGIVSGIPVIPADPDTLFCLCPHSRQNQNSSNPWAEILMLKSSLFHFLRSQIKTEMKTKAELLGFFH